MSGAVPSVRRGGHSARVVLQARDGLRSACRRGEREVVAIGRRRCRPTVARTLPVSGVLTYWIDQGPVAGVTSLDVPRKGVLTHQRRRRRPPARRPTAGCRTRCPRGRRGRPTRSRVPTGRGGP